MEAERLAHILIIGGVAISILAFLLIPLLALLSGSGPSVSGGGCIVILFLPVCFGLGEQPLLMVLVAMLMALAIMALSYLLFRAMRSPSQHR
ncbi:MAG: hypothetical protein QXR35_02820 [Candidatus Korarchaeum sp.]